MGSPVLIQDLESFHDYGAYAVERGLSVLRRAPRPEAGRGPDAGSLLRREHCA